MQVLNTNRYPNLQKSRSALSEEQEHKSWLLHHVPPEKEHGVCTSIEATLSKLVRYPGYETAALNLVRAHTWDEYQEHRWMMRIALHLQEESLLRELETELPNGCIPDMSGEVLLEGQTRPFYVEAKSWRFHPSKAAFNAFPELPMDQRVERMKKRLRKQLPENSLGVWAWDKMRDGISGSVRLGSDGPKPGVEESQVIREVCGAVPQLAAVMFMALDMDRLSNDKIISIIRTVSSPSSKWPQALVCELVGILNSLTIVGGPGH